MTSNSQRCKLNDQGVSSPETLLSWHPMSLSRILNDDPPPPARQTAEQTTHSWHDLPDDHPRYRYDDHSEPHPSSSATRIPHNDWHDRPPSDPWNSRQRPSDLSPMHPGYNEHPASSDERLNDPAALRKKRKNTHDESDYQPGSSKRKSKGKRRMSTSGGLVDTLNTGGSHVRRPSDTRAQFMSEEARLASSDLEDCEEVWLAELSDYILETKKRQNQVAQYFWQSVVDRNAKTSHDLTRGYTAKISGIPLHAPSPHGSPHPPPRFSHVEHNEHLMPNGVHHHEPEPIPSRDEQDFGISAEDAANDLEHSVLGDLVPEPTPPAPVVISKRKGKGKKRAAQDADRHSGNENEAITTTKKKKAAAAAAEVVAVSATAPPPTKKRRLEKEAASVADDVERALLDVAPQQPPPASAPVKPPKAKGKAKQLQAAEELQREPSMDSVSASAPPTKPRKKPGPKKKLGLAPEVESEIAAASSAVAAGTASLNGSGPPSVSGDVTPSFSRATSPVPGVMSTLYDLDDPIPPLKKAKKIDDIAMVKRIKTLEDAQKKVIRYSPGIQISFEWLPNSSFTIRTNGQVRVHPGSQTVHEDRQSQQGHSGQGEEIDARDANLLEEK